MPPKKEEKVKQVKGEEAADMIMDYLREQNRPYSATDISANLHNAVTKTNAAKLLKDLSDKGDLKVAVSGKQMVYHIPQDPDDFASPEALASMDTVIQNHKDAVTSLKAEQKSLQMSLQQLKSMPTFADLSSSIQNLTENVKAMKTNLAKLKRGSVEPISPQEKEKMAMELKTMTTLHGKRKKTFMEYWSMVKDRDEMKVEDLWNSIGLDEYAHVDKRIIAALP